MSINSITVVDAKALNTKKVVETGIPNLVSNKSIDGATTWYHAIGTCGILVNLPYEISPSYAHHP